MPFKKGHIAFTGSDAVLCGYISRGRFIYRAASSLTGERVKADPAFEGFRRSCNRMKEASPIAAALYNQIPKGEREYWFYRFLTGEALKMLKLGLSKTEIIAKLEKQYIEPLIRTVIEDHPQKAQTKQTQSDFSAGRLFSCNICNRATNRISNLRMRRKLKQIAIEHYKEPPSSISGNNAASQTTKERPIYLGRHKEFKGFKLWLIPFS